MVTAIEEEGISSCTTLWRLGTVLLETDHVTAVCRQIVGLWKRVEEYTDVGQNFLYTATRRMVED